MVELIRGLRGQEDAPHLTTVSKLTVSSCRWQTGSLLHFRNFLQTRTSEDLASSERASFDELVFHVPNRSTSSSMLHGQLDEFTSVDFLSMLALQDGNGQAEDEEPSLRATVGSRIQSTSVFCHTDWYRGFFQFLANNASLFRISKLHVEKLREDEVAALAECITNVASLRELSFSDFPYWCDTDLLLSSLKRSDNIRAVSGYGGAKPKLVQAYCERNQFVHEVLTPTTSSDLEEEKSDDDDDDINPQGQVGLTDRLDAGLFPSVALATEPLPSTMARIMLQKIGSLP